MELKSAPTDGRQSGWSIRLDVVASAFMIVAATVLTIGGINMLMAAHQAEAVQAGRGKTDTVPKIPVALAGAVLRGSPTAKVGLIEFSDFQCPFCGKVARGTLSEIMSRYVDPGLVLFAFRNLPLESLHKFALGASRSALCAEAQGKFWPMHDALFADQEHLEEVAQSLADRLGLDRAQYAECVSSQRVSDRISADEGEARVLDVTGTPTIFVGLIQSDGRLKVTRRFSGVQPVETMAGALDQLLKGASH